METTTYVALSRQMVLRRDMDIIANNMANMTSSGFRAEALLFEAVPVDAGERQRVNFVQDVALVRDLSPGTLTPTGNQFDLAIDGEGYFVVGTPEGPRFTRGGQFRLNEIGELTTPDGNPVLDNGGAPLAIPLADGPVAVAADGTISTSVRTIGRLDIVTFDDHQDLEKAGDGLYRTDQAPAPAAGVKVVQGMLEGSNVRPIVEMTEMMSTVRAYQGTQRLIDTHHEMQRKTIERVLEVNG
jgi:flagellar basal-body rod protein FlgF